MSLKDSILNRLNTRDSFDLHGRKFANGGTATDPKDFVLLKQVQDAVADLISLIKGGLESILEGLSTGWLTIVSSLPTFTLKRTDDTVPQRICITNKKGISLTSNIYYDQTLAGWYLDDTSIAGWVVYMDGANGLYLLTATAGTGARTLTTAFRIDPGSKFYWGSTKVLDARQSDIGAPTSMTALNTTQTAGGTYTTTEQNMLNAIKADLTNLKSAVDNYKTRLDNVRSTFQNHGLTS